MTAPMEVDSPAVVVTDLSFSYGGPEVLKKVSLSVNPGSRCLLVGRNGAGKSTLLDLLAGARMGPTGAIKVHGKVSGVTGLQDPFRVSGLTAHLRGAGEGFKDQSVTVLAKSVLKVPDVDPERKKRLISALEIDPKWNMSRSSASQRLRVRLALALLKPRDVILLDEVTAELDLLTRESLLAFLKEESESGIPVIICTHNFEGLDGWPTHAVLIHEGTVAASVTSDELVKNFESKTGPAAAGLVSQAISAWMGKLGNPGDFQLPRLPGAENWPKFDQAFEADCLEWSVDGVDVIRSNTFQMPKGCRCVLVGSAGAGKSSLLALLAGRRMASGGSVKALGLRAFHDYAKLTPLIALLSDEWKQQVHALGAGGHMPFDELLGMGIKDLTDKGMDESAVRARAKALTEALEVGMNWTPATASDGQLRRMQLVRSLLEPKALLILDEATTDLDLLARQSLLKILLEESQLGASVVISTNAFDGLDGWATHAAFLTRNGQLGFCGAVESLPTPEDSRNGFLHSVANAWLRADFKDSSTERPIEIKPTFVVIEAADPDLPAGWEKRTAGVQGAYGDHAWGDRTTNDVAPPRVDGSGGAGAGGGFGGGYAGAANMQPPGGFGAPGGQGNGGMPFGFGAGRHQQ